MAIGDLEIQYSRAVPTEEIGAVAAPTRVDTGAQYIARGMEALGQGFDEITSSRRSMEVSTRQRAYAEITSKAMQEYAKIGDPNERKKRSDQWSKDVEGVFTTNDPFLRRELNLEKNRLLPIAGQHFSNMELEIQQRNDDDAYKSNYQWAAENNKPNIMIDLNNERVAHNRMSPAERDERNKDAPNDSVLAQAERAIGNGDGKGAQAILSQAKDMTIQQVEKWHQLNAWSKQVGKVNSDNSKDEVVNLMTKNENALARDKDKLANQMMLDLQKAGVTGDDYLQWAGPNGVIARWKADKFEIDNPETLASLNRDIRDVSLGNLKRAEVDDYIRKSVEDGFINGKTAGALLKDNYDDFKKYQTKALTEEIDYAEKILIPKRRTATEMSIDEMLSAETAVVDSAADIAKRTEGYARLQWVDEQLRDYVKKNPDVMADEIHIKGRRFMAMAQAGKIPTQAEYVVRKDEDYRALPSGAIYKAPDGRIMRKP